MRVAEISAFSDYSVGNIMRDIQSFLLSNGHECKIFYARGLSIEDEGFLKYGYDIQTNINAMSARIFDNDGFFDIFNTRKLIKSIEKYSPDIVHIHCLHGYHLNVKTLFKYLKNKKIKIIWTMHDMWAMTGHCCYYCVKNCHKWKRECFSCPNKKEYPKSYFFDRSRKNFLRA